MKPSPARLALALLAAAVAGPAWGAGGFMDRSGIAADDARRRYADCTALVAGDPGAAFDSALAWRREDGGAAAYRHLDALDLAADDVARALALAPDDPAVLLERGNIRRLSGDDSGARKDWLRILTEAPESPAASAAQTNLERLDVKPE